MDRKYEVMFIVRPDTAEEDLDRLLQTMETNVAATGGKVTGFEVTDPKTGATRILGPERIVPYLRNVAAKVASLTPKNVVPITSTKSASAKKAAAAPKVN